jgi:hypothetical protein
VPARSERTSGEGSDSRGGSSVHDFLYYDTRRIASYLSQLGQYGAPGRLTHHQETGETATTKAGGRLSGGAPGIAAAESAEENARDTRWSEHLDQEFDPFWLAGLNLHDELTKRRLIRSDLAQAAIGDFVDVQGALGIVDFTMFLALWQRRSVHDAIESGVSASAIPSALANMSRQQRRAQDRNRAPPSREQSSIGQLIADILAAIPHPVQARMLTEQRQATWSTLRQDGLVTEVQDVLLKHGFALDGRWRIFGVLDAMPRPDDDETDPLKIALTETFAETSFGGIATSLHPLLQSGFARPNEAWGITPVMIYRELNAR